MGKVYTHIKYVSGEIVILICLHSRNFGLVRFVESYARLLPLGGGFDEVAMRRRGAGAPKVQGCKPISGRSKVLLLLSAVDGRHFPWLSGLGCYLRLCDWD